MSLLIKLNEQANIKPVEIVELFFQARSQIHYWHLQTESYAEHKALDAFYTQLVDLADTFIEQYQGTYKRVKGKFTMSLDDYSDSNPSAYLKEFGAKLKPIYEHVKEHTDLTNVLDEVYGLIDKTLYLLTLK